jgi:hypothetical protein
LVNDAEMMELIRQREKTIGTKSTKKSARPRIRTLQELEQKVFVFAKTFAIRSKNIAKKIEILLIGCERGKFKTWSHLRVCSQLVDEW